MRFVGPWVIAVVLSSLAVPARAGTATDEPAAPAAAADEPAAPAAATDRPAISAAALPNPAAVFAPPPDGSGKARTIDRPMALSVNAPWAWLRNNIGASVYVAVDPHWAMRANFARYDAEEILALLVTGEGFPYSGEIFDLGLGWVWYPRALWDGFTFEAGGLVRDRDVRGFNEDLPDDDIQTTTYAARAMIGWSWLAGRTVFLSFAVGASAGLESGHETIASDRGMETTRSVERLQIDFETSVRIGFAFGR